MRILSVRPIPYVNASGGVRAHRRGLAALARAGHDVTCLSTLNCYSIRKGRDEDEVYPQTLRELADYGLKVPDEPEFHTEHRGVHLHFIRSLTQIPDAVRRLVAKAPFDRVAVPYVMTPEMAEAIFSIVPAERITMTYNTSWGLPRGPDAIGDKLLHMSPFIERSGRHLAISRYVADYVSRWFGVEARCGHYDTYEDVTPPDLGNPADGSVMLINAAVWKGLPVFGQLALRMPDVRFATVKTWGSVVPMMQMIDGIPNIEFVDPVSPNEIDTLYAKCRVLLVPSLWPEGFGLVNVEAMLRGIPVVASKSGGIPEAKLGVPYLLDLPELLPFEGDFTHDGIAIRQIPPLTDEVIQPWVDTVRRLLSDHEHYRQISRESRAAAIQYVANLRSGGVPGWPDEFTR